MARWINSRQTLLTDTWDEQGLHTQEGSRKPSEQATFRLLSTLSNFS